MPSKPKPALEVQPRRPRGRPKAEDLAGLEARLINVAREAFYKNGYGATTMDSVAMAARVSKATLYTRFPSKPDLFRAIVEDQIAKWGSGPVISASDEFDTLKKALLAYADLCVRAAMSEEFAQINRLVFGESQRFPELGEMVGRGVEMGVDSMVDIIEDFARRDRVPIRDARATAEVFQALMGGWSQSLLMTNQNPSPEARQAWLEKAVRIFLGGRPAW